MSPMGPGKATTEHKMHTWRVYVFASTWFSYVGYYFCRKAFFVVKGDLTTDLGLDPSMLSKVGMAYLIAYAVGEFNAAAMGTKFGPRKLVLTGMGVSVLCNICFGFANNMWTFMAFMFLNGLAQSTGWSGNVGTMAQWFRKSERGRVLGAWGTCFSVGGAVAKGFAAFMLGLAGWRWSFWAASLVLGAIWLLFYALQRNKPEDVGLPPIDDAASEAKPVSQVDPKKIHAREDSSGGFSMNLLTTILMMGSFYFFIKFIRYALWSWAPYFLQLSYGLAHDKAGYFSTLFDIFGFFGVIGAGYISDKFFRGGRALLSLIMLVGLTLTTLVLWKFGSHSLLIFGITYSLIGFLLCGPDSLISGAGAIDVGSKKYAVAAAGMINGMGSIGSVVQEIFIGRIYKAGGDVTPILYMLLFSAACSTVMITLLVLRARKGKCNL